MLTKSDVFMEKFISHYVTWLASLLLRPPACCVVGCCVPSVLPAAVWHIARVPVPIVALGGGGAEAGTHTPWRGHGRDSDLWFLAVVRCDCDEVACGGCM